MFIIIDGYNLIRQSSTLRRYELKSLEAGRQALVSRLSDYQSKKRHTITVVFDGWQGGSEYEERDRYAGIDIIYSHYGQKADEVIKRIVAQSDEETIVVSSDREIASYAISMGKTTFSSMEFEVLMNKTIISSSKRRYASIVVDEKVARGKKKGPAKRLSKAQKSMQKIISRL